MKFLKNKKIILAVSGGPDSMFLLNKYKKYNITVAFINYNQRENSYIDEQIVSVFCSQHNINLLKLCVNKNDYQGGNFQNWAREIRYKFFKEIYIKEKADYLFTAHHLDDFLETAIMQKESHRFTFFYGIKKNSYLNGMKIYRPFVNRYFKKTILKKCEKKNIPFAVDYTNEIPKYTRNKIRLTNQNKSFFSKYLMYLWFKNKNLSLKNIENSVNLEYKIWKEKDFSQDLFELLKYKNELIFKLINNQFENIELSTKKINSIVQFVLSPNRTSKYLLKKDVYLIKNKGQILFK
ncbi:tRNA lysidine(34) synthetase TilS [Mycoplasma buteonis]|uniref:tRNA lysidine(34) synthetase TilS n=1 Tax=Mycoplasma buteonis TaxID=171280 RepID=UPI00055D3AC0|nr:tRNA lysidine(34) synthetase TilS [Mycoplasma buteonis]